MRCPWRSIRKKFIYSVVTTVRPCADNGDKKVVLTLGGKRMSWHYKLAAFASAAAVAVFVSAGAIAPASAEEIVLKMAVPDWPPTRIMKDLFDKNYKAPSGNDVKLEIDFIPWPDYYTRLNASLTSGEQKYNMAVSDSQWLGAFIEGGYYRKVNDLIDADPALKAALQICIPHRCRPMRPILTSRRTYTASRRCRTFSSPTIARMFSVTTRSRRTFRRNITRSCPARRKRWTTSTGMCSKRSASSSRERRATCSPASRQTM